MSGKTNIIKNILNKETKKIIVKGKTYPIKSLLKELGYKFNKYGPHWELDTCISDVRVRRIYTMTKDKRNKIWMENV